MIQGDNAYGDEMSLKLRTQASKERNGHIARGQSVPVIILQAPYDR